MATTKWNLDPTHSEVQFKVKHLMITTVTGNIGSFEITSETESDDFSAAKISFSADAASIDTGNEQRDGHLKSADFFDVEKAPKIEFTSTKVEKLDASNLKLTGNLTIKGTSKPVTLDVEFGGIQKDPWGNTKAGFTVSGKINRKDWGLNWNATVEGGGVLVSEDVRILAEIQLVKQA
ncbi:MAG: YceI family protein [Cytophagales bacterium]|nr:YceI family protein [Cytophagales bacterium]